MLHMQNIIVSFTLAVVFVLLGSVATELRWGGRHNFTFTRHEFLVVTVKEWLKLVYFHQSYRKNKSGVPLILDHPVYSTMKTEDRGARKIEISQARSKPDTVDRPVRTARTIVHNTVANSQTIQDIATVTIESE